MGRKQHHKASLYRLLLGSSVLCASVLSPIYASATEAITRPSIVHTEGNNHIYGPIEEKRLTANNGSNYFYENAAFLSSINIEAKKDNEFFILPTLSHITKITANEGTNTFHKGLALITNPDEDKGYPVHQIFGNTEITGPISDDIPFALAATRSDDINIHDRPWAFHLTEDTLKNKEAKNHITIHGGISSIKDKQTPPEFPSPGFTEVNTSKVELISDSVEVTANTNEKAISPVENEPIPALYTSHGEIKIYATDNIRIEGDIHGNVSLVGRLHGMYSEPKPKAEIDIHGHLKGNIYINGNVHIKPRSSELVTIGSAKEPTSLAIYYGNNSTIEGDVFLNGDHHSRYAPRSPYASITQTGNITVADGHRLQLSLTESSKIVGEFHARIKGEEGREGNFILDLFHTNLSPFDESDTGPRKESLPNPVWVISKNPSLRASSDITYIQGRGTIDVTGADLSVKYVGSVRDRYGLVGLPEYKTRAAFLSPIARGANRGSVTIEKFPTEVEEPGWGIIPYNYAEHNELTIPTIALVATDYVKALKDVNRGHVLPSIFKGDIPTENVNTYVTYIEDIPSSLIDNALINKKLADGTWVVTGIEERKPSHLANVSLMMSPTASYDSLIHTALSDSLLERMGDGGGLTSGTFARVTHAGYQKKNTYEATVKGLTIGLERVTETEKGAYIHTLALKREEGALSFKEAEGASKMKTTLLSYYYTDKKHAGRYTDTSIQLGRVHSRYDVTGPFGTATGTPSTRAIILGTEYGREIKKSNAFSITPHIGIQYGRLGASHYEVEDIQIYEKGVHSLLARLGLMASYKASNKLSTYGKIGLFHEFLGTRTTLGFDELASDEPFVKTVKQRGTWGALGLGLTYMPNKDAKLFIDAQTMLGNGFKASHKIHVGVHVGF